MTTPADLLKALNWRYATKAFDPARTIPTETWNALEQSLVLAPSSYGLQPWRFVVVTSPEVKAKLRPVSWNQSQVTDCSHLVVFAAKEQMSEEHVDHFVARTAEVRKVTVESVAGYRNMMVSDVVKGPRSAMAFEWAARQCYIAFGQLMTSAAVLGVDACPLEGIDPAKYDEILGMPGTGYKVIAACAVGYRAAGDKYATLAKIRFPTDEVIIRK
jgi:nitroreductase